MECCGANECPVPCGFPLAALCDECGDLTCAKHKLCLPCHAVLKANRPPPCEACTRPCDAPGRPLCSSCMEVCRLISYYVKYTGDGSASNLARFEQTKN